MSNLPAQTRELRGRILKILKFFYPEHVSDRDLVNTLHELRYEITYPVLHGHIAYLKEKGYVDYTKLEHELLSYPRWDVRLTANGMDLLEGIIDSDPGVQL